MPNEYRNPTQAERDELIKMPLDAEEALTALLKVKPTDDDENPSDLADLSGLRTEAEWDALSKEEVEALGRDVGPESHPAKRNHPKD